MSIMAIMTEMSVAAEKVSTTQDAGTGTNQGFKNLVKGFLQEDQRNEADGEQQSQREQMVVTEGNLESSPSCQPETEPADAHWPVHEQQPDTPAEDDPEWVQTEVPQQELVAIEQPDAICVFLGEEESEEIEDEQSVPSSGEQKQQEQSTQPAVEQEVISAEMIHIDEAHKEVVQTQDAALQSSSEISAETTSPQPVPPEQHPMNHQVEMADSKEAEQAEPSVSQEQEKMIVADGKEDAGTDSQPVQQVIKEEVVVEKAQTSGNPGVAASRDAVNMDEMNQGAPAQQPAVSTEQATPKAEQAVMEQAETSVKQNTAEQVLNNEMMQKELQVDVAQKTEGNAVVSSEETSGSDMGRRPVQVMQTAESDTPVRDPSEILVPLTARAAPEESIREVVASERMGLGKEQAGTMNPVPTQNQRTAHAVEVPTPALAAGQQSVEPQMKAVVPPPVDPVEWVALQTEKTVTTIVPHDTTQEPVLEEIPAVVAEEMKSQKQTDTRTETETPDILSLEKQEIVTRDSDTERGMEDAYNQERRSLETDIATEGAEAPIRTDGIVRSFGTVIAQQVAPDVSTRIMHLQDLIARFDEHVLNMAGSPGERTMNIILEPRNLGKITLRCREEGAEMAIEVVAGRQGVSDLLRQQEAGLRDVLQQNGYQLSQFDVRSEGEHPDDGRSQQFDLSGEKAPVDSITGHLGDDETEPVQPTWSRRDGIWAVA